MRYLLKKPKEEHAKIVCKFANMADKKLYIIAGCNGAGKTTASFTILPEILTIQKLNTFL